MVRTGRSPQVCCARRAPAERTPWRRRPESVTWLPAVRQELVDTAGLVRGQPGEHVLEVRIGVVPVHACRLNQAHHRRRPPQVPTHCARVERGMARPARAKMLSWRNKGKWSAYLATSTWASRPAVGIPLSITCASTGTAARRFYHCQRLCKNALTSSR